MYKIDFNREECLGCGACTMCNNWEFSADGKVSPVQNEFEEPGCNIEASEICPAQVIKIINN
ncbi:hypothetical protein C0584_03790 [Candidatus Parcubacteria bacterium]|nr:MAG: hypothetical protein C0584_03790 [Candidatus Parcubacteria bacterium]